MSYFHAKAHLNFGLCALCSGMYVLIESDREKIPQKNLVLYTMH